MERIDYKEIGERIRWMIKNDHREQKELVEHLGKSRQVFYDWSTGRGIPSLADLFKIAKYFGVPLEYVIFGEESPIDDATIAFQVSTQGLTEEQKGSIYASLKAQIKYWKDVNSKKKKSVDNNPLIE